jgi:sterol desaturase/sphingolipid hydroxylase (fatty acid hydroxylase superfamily)
MSFLIFLLISVLFVVLERLLPRRPQAAARAGIVTDVAHWLFNGYLFYALIYGAVSGLAFEWFTRTVRSAGFGSVIDLRLLTGQPLWLQFILLFLVQDFLMWCTHNLLHRVPALWAIHRVHHSITTMDWIGNMRYHWGEIAVYNSVMFLPVMILGADASLFLWINIFNTFIGHFNHANLRVSLGPLKYVFNSPEMHIWHHDKDGPGSHNKNFAIGLSVWDWIFGTAYMPAADQPAEPRALGFAGIEEFPRTFVGQQLLPLSRRWRGRALYTMIVLALLATTCAGQTRSGAVTIDRKARSVSFTATVHPARYNGAASTLKDHHFIVWKGGRAAANALVAADANDLDVQRALESLGATAGNNLTADSWDKRADPASADPDLHVSGSALDVTIAWAGHAAVKAGDIFVDRGGRGFAFKLGGNESLIPTWRSGCIVCLESCPGGRSSNAAYTMRDLYAGRARFDLRTGVLPAEGTVVTVTMRVR